MAATLPPLRPTRVNPADRLGLALFLAAALHAMIILGVGFRMPLPAAPPLFPTLDVTLVASRSEAPPEDADFLAQANQLGGGEEEAEPERPASPAQTPFPASRPEPASLIPGPEEPAPPRPPEPQPAAAPERRAPVTTTAPAPEKVPPREPAPPTARPKPEAAPSASQLITRSLAIASLTAEYNQQREAYSQRERVRTISANTRESRFALYLDAWRRKVERIGNLNYPDEAKRQGVSGSLRLLVRLNTDGTVREVEMLKSSGSKLLDDAALRIVHLAAPFAPLPESITRDTDVLEIIRTWVFRSDNRLVSQ